MIITLGNTSPRKYPLASANAAMFGVPKMFTPVWWRWLPWSPWNYYEDDDNNKIYDRNKREQQEHYYDFLNPRNWTYFYDHSQLAKTLDRYIDYKKLNLAAKRRTTRSSSPYNNCCRCDDS